jgi:hypothetical protein
MNGDNDEDRWGQQPGKPFDVSAELGEPTTGERLALGDEERLPWLESADDIDGEEEDLSLIHI